MLKNVELYIATDGNDANPGTKEQPFQNLEAARDAIRPQGRSDLFRLKKENPENVSFTVFLRGGVYCREGAFELTEEDSGTQEAPIVYQAYENEEVRLVGGKEVEREWFQPVTDAEILARLPAEAHGKVLQADLKAHGICDYGEPRMGGRGLQLFCNDRWMPVARWPNSGYVNTVSAPAEGPLKNLAFVYSEDRPDRWTKAADAQAAGYWMVGYSCRESSIASIDPENKTITFTHPPDYGIRPSGNMPWYAFNLLEEIDLPEEWYLDRESGILYFWPPADFDRGKVFVSLLGKPLITLEETSYITIRGLTLEVARGKAVAIGGTHNLIAGCVIRNVSSDGISLSGTNNGISGCDIYNLGSSSVSLSGGDRRSLTPGKLYVENCHIHHYARLHRNRRGITITGVGNRVAHNLIHDGPQGAIIYSGNDHVMEFNDIHDVVLESGDAGVIYTGRDWTFRGNVVRHNFIHHIPRTKGHAVYLDDIHSSTEVFGNVFHQIGEPVIIGGGRDNIVENNLFIECAQTVHMDNRGLRWESLLPSGEIYKGLEKQADLFTKPPWSTRYPKLARILEEDPRAPLGNTLERNVSYRSGWCNPEERCRGKFDQNIDKQYMKITDNFVTEEDPGFVDAAKMNFQLKDDSVVYQKVPGFKRIPFEEIGLYQDEYRATWPVPRTMLKC